MRLRLSSVRKRGAANRTPPNKDDENEGAETRIGSGYEHGSCLPGYAGLQGGQAREGLATARNSDDRVAGGTGASPLYGLAKKLLAEGRRVSVLLGFATAADVFYEEEYRALGAEVTVCTENGSYGRPGFVTEAMDRPCSYFYTCGPKAMMQAVCACAKTDGELSLAVRMGCGFGACMGCRVETVHGGKRVCKDGPVFGKGEILWDDLQ